MSIEKHMVEHPKFGQYEQTIGSSLTEAGHIPLEGPEGTVLGWIMPSEHATDAFVGSSTGKIVFEIGSGNGERVVEPALKNGAKHVYAVDIFATHLELVKQAAVRIGRPNDVYTAVISDQWWNKELQSSPGVEAILLPLTGVIPGDGIVDLMIARQVVQFGSPESFFRFLDLAASCLRVGGEVWTINMSPFLEYIYDCDIDLDGQKVQRGVRLSQIVARNREFMLGVRKQPGGFARVCDCLPETTMEDFLYFDRDTGVGLVNRWQETRRARGLASHLQIEENYCFGPRSIWKRNKLVGMPEYLNRENHVLVLKKV